MGASQVGPSYGRVRGNAAELGVVLVPEGGGASQTSQSGMALSVEGQAIGAANKVSYQVPSNKAAPVPAAAPRLADIKLINYDFAKYGSSAERKRLLGKWDAEVSTLPK